MSGALSGRIAWITGGSSGIGLASARALAEQGAIVVLSARDAANLDQAVKVMHGDGLQVHPAALDVVDAPAVQEAAAAIEQRFGRIDILVNSAGLNVARRSWADVAPADWNRVLEVNVNGTYHCIRAVLPGMRQGGGGLIVNIASWAGRFTSGKAGPAYNAAKSAVVALTQSLNMEEHRHGIRACALSPGETATPIMAKRATPPTAEQMDRMLQPQDVASAVLMVACMPPRACVNEVVISPTQNHAWGS